MFQSAPSPGRNAPHSAPYTFATPVRTPSTSYSAYAQALTPTDASAKAVRFQNQPLAPQQQSLQQQPSHPQALAATPNNSPYHSAVSASPQSAPLASSAPSRAASSTVSAPKMAQLNVPSMPASTESSIALKRRIKWNLGALGLLWIVPALTTKPRDLYWLVLDQIYLHVGGETDEVVDGVVGWILWAVSVVLLFNAVEAAVGMGRASSPAPISGAPQAAVNKAGRVLGMHSPQVAKSINFVAASRLKGSPKTRTSNIGAGSPISCSPGGQQRASPTQASPGSGKRGGLLAVLAFGAAVVESRGFSWAGRLWKCDSDGDTDSSGRVRWCRSILFVPASSV